MALRKPLVLVAGARQQIQTGDNPCDGDGRALVPDGGTVNQVLAKASSTNRDTAWVDASGGVSLSNVFAIASLRI